MKENASYIKHIYWLTEREECDLREELSSNNIPLRAAKGVVCTPLDRITRIGTVTPSVWNETCARQGSWYRTSGKRGLYLIISSFELPHYEDCKAATITESEFRPPRYATGPEKRDLVRHISLDNVIPEEWERVGETEKRIYLRWARRLGSNVDDYESLFLSHTANHANFIHPLFYQGGNRGIIPYSIDRSAHLCSSCLELFQVLGGDFDKKLVAPCPGATIFARLRPDRYLLVQKA